jgi:histidinol dehydrogenase
MPSDFEQTKRKLDEAASKIEQEIRGVIQHLNDHVVPKVRTEGTQALRNVAQELQKLADRMDDSRKSTQQQK